ncbi:MAG: polysaccharide deacetylase family protein [Sphingomonadaceae bacterium]
MPVPPSKVVLSVDTEPTVSGTITYPDRRRPLIDEPVLGMVGGRSEGLGFILDTLREYGLPATFFIETAHVRAFGETPMRRHVETILRADHDVQLHLHPVWTSWRDGRDEPAWRVTDECAQLPRDRLAELFAEGRAMLERWTGKPITAARAGNFSASLDVLRASADAGLTVTSHVNIANRMPPEPELHANGGTLQIAGVREFPATCFRQRLRLRSGWRSLSVAAISADEMISALRGLRHSASGLAMIVMHPFNFLKRRNVQFEGLRADRLAQRRFRKLAQFLADHPRDFAVCTLPQLAAQHSYDGPAPDLRGSLLRTVVRIARNWANDRLR